MSESTPIKPLKPFCWPMIPSHHLPVHDHPHSFGGGQFAYKLKVLWDNGQQIHNVLVHKHTHTLVLAQNIYMRGYMRTILFTSSISPTEILSHGHPRQYPFAANFTNPLVVRQRLHTYKPSLIPIRPSHVCQCLKPLSRICMCVCKD